MTVLVIFTKPGLLRPGTEGERDADTVLFLSRTRSTFDDLFQSLLENEVILDTKNKIGEDIAYTFTENIKQQLEEIDSTVSAVLESQEAATQKELNRLLVEVQAWITAEDYSRAAEFLRNAKAIAPENTQVLELDAQIKHKEEIGRFVMQGDGLYDFQEYGQALDIYRNVQRYAQNYQVDVPGLGDKIMLASLQFALALA